MGKDKDIAHMLLEIMMMELLLSQRPTDITLGCEIDTEKLDEAYTKSGYIKAYNSDDTNDIEGGI